MQTTNRFRTIEFGWGGYINACQIESSFLAGVEGFDLRSAGPRVSQMSQLICDVALRTATGSPHPECFTRVFDPPPFKDKVKSLRPEGLRLFTWLGIKNDYRTLIGVDNLEIIEKADDEDEENSDV